MLINCSLSCVLKNKGIPQYLAAFPQIFEDATAGGSVALQMPPGKTAAEPVWKLSPDTQSGSTARAAPERLEPGQRQEAGSKESSQESPRLPWIQSVGITWAFCNFAPASFVECLDWFWTTYMNEHGHCLQNISTKWLAVCVEGGGMCSMYVHVVCICMCVPVVCMCMYVLCVFVKGEENGGKNMCR